MSWLSKASYILHCSAAALPIYRSFYTATQRNILHLQVKILLQYRNAVDGAEVAIRALQLTARQVQWSMNKA